MKQIVNHSSVESGVPKPMEIVGAGPLLSTIWKLGGELAGWRYRFNLTRQTCDKGVFIELFQPLDLVHLTKLIQVLAFVIADDGCLSQAERTTLKNLSTQLDDLLNGATDEVDEHAAPIPPGKPQPAMHGTNNTEAE